MIPCSMGGEFGRTPMAENREGIPNQYPGRDHHAEAFTMWDGRRWHREGHTYGQPINGFICLSIGKNCMTSGYYLTSAWI